MSKYRSIVSFYEECFEKHGDGPEGHHWPNMPDLIKRYEAMLGVIKENDAQPTLLDFGCGTAMLREHIQKTRPDRGIRYSGLDMSEKFIDQAQEKYPGVDFYRLDILKNPDSLKVFDYIVMNGVFTEKLELTFDEMLEYFKRMLQVVFQKVNRGLAFNVMSKQVDWEKGFLFHLPLDTLALFLTKELTRNFIIRNDYGLYEYTTYVYK